MLDIHNFARWDGGIIGQGGPADEQFVSLWTQLAQKYKGNDKVVFELMNEPHDLDIKLWAATCQKAVTAIRQAGATTQMILLPGTNFNSAEFLVSSGSAEALTAITNPDGTTDGLIIDVHKYLDEDNSGTHRPCTTDNVESFRTVAEYLRSKGRKGLVSETGASSDASVSCTLCRSEEHKILTGRVVLHELLRTKYIHQPELRRLHWPRRMGSWQLRHQLRPQLDANEIRQRLYR